MTARSRIVALIPARAGSRRVPGKNIRSLAGHPLLAYAIQAAIDSEIFEKIVVSTDSEEYAAIARHYGAEVPFLRPQDMAGDTSPDIEWVCYTLTRLRQEGFSCDCFSILRPTSPFRTAATIKRAWTEFSAERGIDSLRAVELCRQHPGKMWVVHGKRMVPLLPLGPAAQPWHSSQYQSLPPVHVQNASLEIAWARLVFEGGTIAGNVVMPFFTEDVEGFDINHPIDWRIAEEMVAAGAALLPGVRAPIYVSCQPRQAEAL